MYVHDDYMSTFPSQGDGPQQFGRLPISMSITAACSIPIPQSELDQSKVGLIRPDRHVGHYIWIVLVRLRRYYLSELVIWMDSDKAAGLVI
ncbi:hypothetical protein DY000_02036965 [Brassica cretica]|uniref:Uncharacterized protein n=1 Tax=Brassica cretica TaxID=69181 RepID=A0ABQ7BM89_BRACR|nr:hypothetical protein DY000_02036965 [Brassica cretica]